jgi:hypothetical protein
MMQRKFSAEVEKHVITAVLSLLLRRSGNWAANGPSVHPPDDMERQWESEKLGWKPALIPFVRYKSDAYWPLYDAQPPWCQARPAYTTRPVATLPHYGDTPSMTNNGANVIIMNHPRSTHLWSRMQKRRKHKGPIKKDAPVWTTNMFFKILGAQEWFWCWLTR